MTIKEKKERVYRLTDDLGVVENALYRIDEVLGCISSAMDEAGCIDEVDDGDGWVYSSDKVADCLNEAEDEAERFKGNLESVQEKIRKELDELEEELGGVYEFTELDGNALMNAISNIKFMYHNHGSDMYTINEIIDASKTIAFDCGGSIISVDRKEV